MRLFAAGLLISLYASAALPAARAGGESVELKIKAAIVYSVSLHVTWPPSTFPDAQSPLRICILQADALAAEMERGVQNRTVQGRAVQVIPITDVGDIRSCHVAYLGDFGAEPLALRQTAGRPVLTVHEASRPLKDGVLRLLRDGGKLRFEINSAAADRCHLEISPRLVRLAIVTSEW